jgi:hypothetical protein
VVAGQHRPPAPIFLDVIDQHTMTSVLRWTWHQPTSAATSFIGTSAQVLNALKQQVDTLPNPITSLIETLEDAARACERLDMVPVGVHLHTTHEVPAVDFLDRGERKKIAIVNITVTAVPAPWARDRVATEATPQEISDTSDSK